LFHYISYNNNSRFCRVNLVLHRGLARPIQGEVKVTGEVNPVTGREGTEV